MQRKHFLVLFIILVISVPVWFLNTLHRTMYSPMLVSSELRSIKLYPGKTIHDLAKTLYQKQLIKHPHFFVFVARFTGKARKLRFGDYRITSGMTATELLDNISSGNGVMKYQITLVEGWTFRDMLNAIEADENLFDRLKGKSFDDVMTLIGHADQHPEGLFLPDTYTFIWGNTDIEILKHAYDRMQTYLSAQWQKRAPGLFYKNAYQVLIVASLIEKETSLAGERPIVASVILNRLKKRMRLQVDPTVLYGLNKPYGTRITRSDLRSKTPYNTYRRYGLPPTPIDMPSQASIEAALHPAHTRYLYYVATGDGSHVFSVTYRQHLHAVKKYRVWQKQQLEDQ